MRGGPGDTWSLTPQAPAHAIPGVRLEHDHGADLSGSCVLRLRLLLLSCRDRDVPTLRWSLAAETPSLGPAREEPHDHHALNHPRPPRRAVLRARAAGLSPAPRRLLRPDPSGLRPGPAPVHHL